MKTFLMDETKKACERLRRIVKFLLKHLTIAFLNFIFCWLPVMLVIGIPIAFVVQQAKSAIRSFNTSAPQAFPQRSIYPPNSVQTFPRNDTEGYTRLIEPLRRPLERAVDNWTRLKKR